MFTINFPQLEIPLKFLPLNRINFKAMMEFESKRKELESKLNESQKSLRAEIISFIDICYPKTLTCFVSFDKYSDLKFGEKFRGKTGETMQRLLENVPIKKMKRVLVDSEFERFLFMKAVYINSGRKYCVDRWRRDTVKTDQLCILIGELDKLFSRQT